MKAVKISAELYYNEVEYYKRAIERLWNNVKNAVTREEYEAAVEEYECKKECFDYYTLAYVPYFRRA